MYVIDIETMPHVEKIELLPEPDVKLGNTKDPQKIEAKKKEAKQKQIDEMALNSLFGVVCCICVYGGESFKIKITGTEDVILRYFFANFLKTKEEKIITYNGINFDIPFIYKRAIINNIIPTIPLSNWIKRYSTFPHCDIMQVWSNWGYKNESLNTMANVLLGEEKKDIDFRKFPEMVLTEDGRNEIAEYCMKDCKLTWKLYHQIRGVLF